MRLFALLSLLLLLLAAPAAAEIEIRAPGQQTISLASTRLLPQGIVPAQLIDDFDQSLSEVLEMSGLFSMVAPASFLSDARKVGLSSSQVDFGQWRLLGADVVVKGVCRLQNGSLVVEARLFDIAHRRLLTGRRYIGEQKDVRRMAHRFADQILKSLTGEEGPFSSRIAYINNISGHKELYLMDVDGRNAVRLTNHRSIVLNPDFSPTGKELLFTSYRAGNPDLYRKEIYSGREARVSSRQGLNIAGRFRPDGREIALTLSKDGNSDLHLLGTDGSHHKQLTDHWSIDVDPSWSPAGDKLAFVGV